MIENHIGSERTALLFRHVEGINHRQTVSEKVGQTGSYKGLILRCSSTLPGPTIFNETCFDMAVFDHHRIIDAGHIGHATIAMPRVKVAAKKDILLRGRLSPYHIA